MPFLLVAKKSLHSQDSHSHRPDIVPAMEGWGPVTSRKEHPELGLVMLWASQQQRKPLSLLWALTQVENRVRAMEIALSL